MPDPKAPVNARLARAAWAYSGLSQKDMADAAGIKPGTLRGYLRRDEPKVPGLPELRRLIEASGLPVSLNDDSGDKPLTKRVAELEDQVRRIYQVAFTDVSAALGADPREAGGDSQSGGSTGPAD